jgi:CRISPR-associated protein Csh1
VNLTQAVSRIGKAFIDKYDNELCMLVEKLPEGKKDQTNYVVYMVFNIPDEIIEFEIINELKEESAYKYNYLGTNKGRSAQIYLTRELNKVNYLFNNVFNDLLYKLKENEMQDCQLAKLINKLADFDMIRIGEKLGEGSINPARLSIFKNESFTFKISTNSLKVNDDSLSFKELLNKILDNKNKNNVFELIVPVIIDEDHSKIILSKHPDYIELVKKEQKLQVNSKSKNKKVCHVCLEEKKNVSSEYTKKFMRKGINKIFTTTTKNTSQMENGFSYDDVYGICITCFQNLKAGEKVIFEDFQCNIANERVFLLPIGYLDDFEYDHLYKVKHVVDLAFHTETREEWLSNLGNEADRIANNYYSLNFLFYRTDGNSISILETIEDVPTLHFQKVIDELEKVSYNYFSSYSLDDEQLTLGKIYNLIPVRVNKKREQLDIQRVLLTYKSILTGKSVKSRLLYQYLCEALDKGMKQLSKSQINNYFNMKLNNYFNDQEDFFIKRIIVSYLTLIETLKNLDLMDVNFTMEGGEVKMGEVKTNSNEVNKKINIIESFLEEREFLPAYRALFYLGALVHSVGVAQYNKGHKKKPVLKKIQFQGMSFKEIKRLYCDIVEKLVQYDYMTLTNEALLNRFDHYIKNYDDSSWSLGDQENILYLMSGYAFMVGKDFNDEIN